MLTPMPMTATSIHQINRWLYMARPGDTMVYHVGNLAADRMYVDIRYVNGRRVVKEVYDPVIEPIAAKMYKLATANEVHLFQRRLTSNTCAYIAVRR